MAKALVIAEKPSVAADLARALGGLERKGDFFEGEEFVVSSAVGHLVELCLPSDMEKQRGKWSMANLPVIPEEFELRPIEKSTARLNVLKRLIKRKDIDRLINACDAGREGELIFRYLVRLVGSEKPIQRLWLQSMTRESIRQAFERLRSDEELRPLADAAVCRSESDWLVGINSTRAMTAFNSKTGGFQLTPVGRVQTPTLAILVEREERIRSFVSRTYWEVHGTFAAQAGPYPGRWFDQGFKKDKEAPDADDVRAERIWSLEIAEAIRSRCTGQPGVVEETRKPGTQAPPMLYDLTSLQRDANGRFGFSAGRTLQLAQRLYERHKALTYPRTDSRCLPEDYVGVAKNTLAKIGSPELARHARHALEQDWVHPNKRIFNNAKVSDHFAIIPTTETGHKLDEAEQKLYDLVVKRFIAVFYPPMKFETTTRITRIREDAFKTEGKVVIHPGWTAVYGKTATLANDEEQNLTPVAPGEQPVAEAVDVKESQTKPPARYTEATLLSAMEGAGKLVDDEDLRDAMSEKGLGTPATRAATIEGLLGDGYINREGRELLATSKGISLINLLRSVGVDTLTRPEMTGEWEFKLRRMELGQFPRPEFMAEIRKLTREIVEKTRSFEDGTVSGDYVDLDAPCPKCKGGPFREEYKSYECKSCGLRFWKMLAGREFERGEISTLLREGRIGPLEGFRSKQGRLFSAEVKLGEDHRASFDFGDSDAAGGAVDLATAKIVHDAEGTADGKLYEFDAAFYALLPDAKPDAKPFRIGKEILQKAISVTQVQKLLATGRTDLLDGFVSKRTRRGFKAFLKLVDGEAKFEFEPRPAKKPGAKRTAKSAKLLDAPGASPPES